MMMNHLSFSGFVVLCAVERSFLELFGSLSIFVCSFRFSFCSFIRFGLVGVHIGFVDVYGCHSE